MKISRSRRLPLVLTAALLAFTSGIALMAAEASPEGTASTTHSKNSQLRPGNVPAEYVVTPFGYFHPSCVHTLAKQDIQLADGRIQHADGVTDAASSCNYGHYLKDGSQGLVGKAKFEAARRHVEASTNVSDGEDAEVTSAEETPFGGLNGTWIVPEKPKANDLQILYFWQGFEDAGSGESVLQPVMTWNGAGRWTISSWNCCLSNIVVQSPPVDVSTGDVIYGSITHTCPAGTISCPTWNVLAVDLTTGKSSLLAETPSEGQAMSWAFGAFLEPYGVVSCDDYPNGGPLHFFNVTILDTNLKPLHHQQWKNDYTSTPHCGFKVKVEDPHDITLFY